MPVQRTITLYEFKELEPEIQKKVLYKHRDMLINCAWWDSTYEDAERAGLTINGFDCAGHTISATLCKTVMESVNAILADHGKACDTYKLAAKTKETYTTARLCGEAEEAERTYLLALGRCYLKMLGDEYDYLTSDAAIKEHIEANEWLFHEDGRIYDD